MISDRTNRTEYVCEDRVYAKDAHTSCTPVDVSRKASCSLYNASAHGLQIQRGNIKRGGQTGMVVTSRSTSLLEEKGKLKINLEIEFVHAILYYVARM